MLPQGLNRKLRYFPDCAEEQDSSEEDWRHHRVFRSAIEFAGERTKDVEQIEWKEKRTKTGAKQIVEFAGGLVRLSTVYDFSYDETIWLHQDERERKFSALAFQTTRRKIDYKTVRTIWVKMI